MPASAAFPSGLPNALGASAASKPLSESSDSEHGQHYWDPLLYYRLTYSQRAILACASLQAFATALPLVPRPIEGKKERGARVQRTSPPTTILVWRNPPPLLSVQIPAEIALFSRVPLPHPIAAPRRPARWQTLREPRIIARSPTSVLTAALTTTHTAPRSVQS